MADVHGTNTAVVGAAPVTDDVFLADRQQFWSFFTSLVTAGLLGIVVLLILMAFFLL